MQIRPVVQELWKPIAERGSLFLLTSSFELNIELLRHRLFNFLMDTKNGRNDRDFLVKSTLMSNCTEKINVEKTFQGMFFFCKPKQKSKSRWKILYFTVYSVGGPNFGRIDIKQPEKNGNATGSWIVVKMKYLEELKFCSFFAVLKIS